MRPLSLFIALLVGIVARAHSQSDATIEGEVFIVTKGAENLRLGAVEIRFYPEATIRHHIAKRQERIKGEMPSFDREIARQDSAIASMKQHIAKLNSLDRQMRNLGGPTSPRNPTEDAKMMRLFESIRDKNVLAKATWPTAQHYFKSLPATNLLTRTDAAGKFTISLPKNQVFILAAHAARETYSTKERFYWLIRFSSDSATKKILLSNHNLVTCESQDSVLHTKSAWHDWSEP